MKIIESIIQELRDVPKIDSKQFEIGLVMAGAVSAGAYTAGVIDFLLESLEEWETQKDNGEDVPGHKVVIKVLSGASAGGMTAALTSAMIHQKATENYKNSLVREAWVDSLDITDLLETNDLKKYNSIRSFLDSEPIEQLSKELIFDRLGFDEAESEKKWTYSVPYIDKELKLFLTLTNLRGIPFEFDLEGENKFRYGMRQHADYLFSRISENTNIHDWEEIRQCAVATGAFPIGLSARLIKRTKQTYHERFKKDNKDISDFLKTNNPDETYDFVAVDGGVLNNEPLELARKAMYKKETSPSSRADHLLEKGLLEIQRLDNEADQKQYLDELLKVYSSKNINKALILIDPFPNTIAFKDNSTESDLGLKKIVMPLIGAIRGQAMFKPEELIFVDHENNFNRYAIAPVRYEGNSKITRNALACGFFEGFGGFLEKDFREHDYQLGRFNCKVFLEKYFVLPAKYFGKPLFGNQAGNDDELLPIIPLEVSGKQAENSDDLLPSWPTMSREKFSLIERKLKRRYQHLLETAVPTILSKRWLWILTIITLGLLVLGQFQTLGMNTMDCGGETNTVLYYLGYVISIIHTYLAQLILLTLFIVLIIMLILKSFIVGYLHGKSIKILRTELEEHGIHFSNKR